MLRRQPGLRTTLCRCKAVLAFVVLAPGTGLTDPGPPAVRLVAVGDICLVGGVERAAARRERTYPFTAMLPHLRGADIAFGNLECVLSTRGAPIPKKYNFRASPWWAGRLREAGFDVLSLANNHTWDYGRTGLADTVRYVRNAGIRPVGAGNTLAEALAMEVITVRGVRVGFLAFLGMFPPLLLPVANKPSVAMGYPSEVRRRVQMARSRADFLVVSLHAGVEMQPRPSPRQREIAQAAIDAGADAVIGHHPHIIQPLEKYRGKPIFYSLGNFVFNPSWRNVTQQDGPWSAMAVLELGGEPRIVSRLVPLRLRGREPNPAKPAR